MLKKLREDIAIVKEKDPAARSSLEIFLTYSGLKAVRSYRVPTGFIGINGLRSPGSFLSVPGTRPASRSTPAHRSARDSSSTTAWA